MSMSFARALGTGANPRAGPASLPCARLGRSRGRRARRGRRMVQDADGNEREAHGPAVDRRGLLRLALAGGALVGVPALVASRAGSTTRSPFDVPFDDGAGSTAGSRRGRRIAPAPATIVSR